MSLLSVNDLNFIELISSIDSSIEGGKQLEILMNFLPIDVISKINSLNLGNDNTVTDNGSVYKDSQAVASFSSDKGGSTETLTYSS